MADDYLLSKVHSLSDLELAFLLSLVAREHCQIRTSAAAIPDLVAELRLISTNIFGLQPAVIACTPQTTLDDFVSGLLVSHASSSTTATSPVPPPSTFRSPSPLTTRSPHPNRDTNPSSHSPATPSAPTRTIAPVILAANLDTAPKAVQIQALELLRTRRVFTRTSVHAAPKTFLFVAVVADDDDDGRRPLSGGQPPLNRWLNDWFYLAHAHSPAEDGYPNLEEAEDDGDEDEADVNTDSGLDDDDDDDGDAISTASSASVVVKPNGAASPAPGRATKRRAAAVVAAGKQAQQPRPHPAASASDDGADVVVTESDVCRLAQLASRARVDVDVARYQHNVASLLRMHRAADTLGGRGSGVSPAATRHLDRLARSLAPLHGLDYVTPALVRLAARKVYLHRVRVAPPCRERSMQWGSELAAVEAVLAGVGPEDVIEDVLGMVTAPV